MSLFSGEEKERALDALLDCLEFINTTCIILKLSDLLEGAFEIAALDKTTFYDSLFLAAAEKEQVPLLTLDKNCIIG